MSDPDGTDPDDRAAHIDEELARNHLPPVRPGSIPSVPYWVNDPRFIRQAHDYAKHGQMPPGTDAAAFGDLEPPEPVEAPQAADDVTYWPETPTPDPLEGQYTPRAPDPEVVAELAQHEPHMPPPPQVSTTENLLNYADNLATAAEAFPEHAEAFRAAELAMRHFPTAVEAQSRPRRGSADVHGDRVKAKPKKKLTP